MRAWLRRASENRPPRRYDRPASPPGSPWTDGWVRSFYSRGERRAERVGDLFAAVAARYDFLNDLQSLGLHRLWKQRLVRLAKVGIGQRALDLCCGTGDVTFALGRAGAEVVGVDFSPAMLAEARARMAGQARRARRAPTGSVTFVEGDAQRLPFPPHAFDAVTISYGLRNLADARRGLAEMWRVAKPGGRVLVLDFGKPAHRQWRRIYYAYLRWLVPVFGRLFCGNAAAYSYILESLENYPAQEGVTRMFRELGAAEVRVLNLLGGAMSIHCVERVGESGVGESGRHPAAGG